MQGHHFYAIKEFAKLLVNLVSERVILIVYNFISI
jgi:hypothetical protein